MSSEKIQSEEEEVPSWDASDNDEDEEAENLESEGADVDEDESEGAGVEDEGAGVEDEGLSKPSARAELEAAAEEVEARDVEESIAQHVLAVMTEGAGNCSISACFSSESCIYLFIYITIFHR